MSAETILIVDDNPTNLGVLFDALRQGGYRVLVAVDSASALEAAHRSHPDLILLDVIMPDRDGFETCQELKATPQLASIPVIFMTALADAVDEVRGLELGAVDYITKPLQIDVVLARLNTHLTLLRLRRELEHKNRALAESIELISMLRGLLPICASCKKIRDDQGYWQQVEVFIERHADVRFSHGICPDCMEEMLCEEHG